MIKLIKLSKCFIFFLTMAGQAKALISEDEKLEFSIFYRKQIELLKIYPTKPEVKVIFTDLDGDNKEEAIATSYEGFYETGWMWSSYKRINAKWIPIKRHDDGKLVSNSKAIYARPGEIFKVTKENGEVEFLILNQNFDNQAPEGKGELDKTRFWIDKDGLMREANVPNMDHYLAYRTTMGGLIQNLEVLKVELFKD